MKAGIEKKWKKQTIQNKNNRNHSFDQMVNENDSGNVNAKCKWQLY